MPDSEKKTTCDKLKCYIQGTLDFTLLKKTTFLLFCIAGVLQKFIVSSYVPHTVNWSVAAGVPRNLAVWALSTLSCAAILSRILVSLIADRKWASRLIIFGCGLFFAFLMCIPPLVFPGIAGSYSSVILFGFHAGLFLSRNCLLFNASCCYMKVSYRLCSLCVCLSVCICLSVCLSVCLFLHTISTTCSPHNE